jgi:phage repressor protein C with HTH and peptisase S24 domain
MKLDIPLLAYIVTQTAPRSVAYGVEAHKEQWFRDRHILFQDGTGYVEEILEEARATLEGQSLPVAPPSLTVVPDSAAIEDEKFESMLPVYSLKAAAGYFGGEEVVEPEGWVDVPGHTLDSEMFVARVVGRSMEPRIGDGDLCIFRRYRGGTRRDRIMLFQWQGERDSETGGSYAVKKYSREQKLVDGDELVGVRVTLTSLNPEYKPIQVEAEYADEISAIAEYVDSLGPESPG